MNQAPTSRARGFVALALATLLVIGIVLSSVLAYRRGHLTDAPLSLTNSGNPLPSQDDRRDAITVAEQFAVRMDTIDTSKLDAYTKSVEELMTTKYKADFEKTAAILPKLLGTGAQKSTGVVLSAGITDQDSDSAVVLVLHAIQVAGKTSGLRWRVDLRKVNGSWLIDNSTDFNTSG